MLKVHENILEIKTEGNQSWTDLCYRLPIADIFLTRKKRQILVNTSVAVQIPDQRVPKIINDDLNTEYQSPFDDYYSDSYEYFEQDPIADAAIQQQVDVLEELPPDIYCDLVETLNDKCLETSILEIWNYDYEIISKLTSEEIVEAVNVIKESPAFGHAFDYTKLLGGIQRYEKYVIFYCFYFSFYFQRYKNGFNYKCQVSISYLGDFL